MSKNLKLALLRRSRARITQHKWHKRSKKDESTQSMTETLICLYILLVISVLPIQPCSGSFNKRKMGFVWLTVMKTRRNPSHTT